MNILLKNGWESLPSGRDFFRGNYMISLFKKSWQVTYSPEQRIIQEGKGELSEHKVKQIQLKLF